MRRNATIGILLFAPLLVACAFTSDLYAEEGYGKKAELIKWGKIIAVYKDQNLCILDIGDRDGIKENYIFEVYRYRSKKTTEQNAIARIQAVNVSKNITACTIHKVYDGQTMEVGDSAYLVAESHQIKTDATKLPIIYELKASPEQVLSTLFTTLRNNGYFISGYDIPSGTLVAHKYVEPSVELRLRKFSQPLNYKIGIVANVKSSRENSSTLAMQFKSGYDIWGEFNEVPLTLDSPYYEEILKITAMLKEESER